MQNGINLGNGQMVTVNLTTITIVFALALIIIVVSILYISMNVSRIARTLEQQQNDQNSSKE